ncbi:unnamed protein product [Orchesella dallaii]|uniref:Uncharacterized protein n=1 Tax=Orchesella dallaii TaxID=48710 RepID=A0ABP1RIK2_9HEXA
MIPLCQFHGWSWDCENRILPVITDYGKCCTFNMLPLPLMYRNPSDKGKKNVSMFDNPILGSNIQWNNSVTKEWSEWNYNEGFVFSRYEIDSDKPYQYFPIKQQGPGKPYGLSILIDPLIDDFYCPMSDAEGMVFTLHKPIEIPNVREFPAVLDTNKEIYINIDPDITFADSDISDLSTKKRQCYFGKEKKLKLYHPYTSVTL